jgi:hypothetical protein
LGRCQNRSRRVSARHSTSRKPRFDQGDRSYGCKSTLLGSLHRVQTS